jgi:hypothetical protein
VPVEVALVLVHVAGANGYEGLHLQSAGSGRLADLLVYCPSGWCSAARYRCLDGEGVYTEERCRKLMTETWDGGFVGNVTGKSYMGPGGSGRVKSP